VVLTAVPTNRFLKDTKLAERRGKDLRKLEAVILLLASGSELPARLKDHALSGDWSHHRDCHIEPDWLLIYKIGVDDLHLVRTGTHSDLFNR
jgi:mRNA interferase YafQ